MTSISSNMNASIPLAHPVPVRTYAQEQRTGVEPSFSHVVMPETRPLSDRSFEQLSGQSSSIPLTLPVFSGLHITKEEEKAFVSAPPIFFEDDLELPSAMPTRVEIALPGALPSAEAFGSRSSIQEPREPIDYRAKYAELEKQEAPHIASEWSRAVVIKAQASLESSSLGHWVTVANLTNDLKLRVKALGCSQSNRGISWDGWQLQITKGFDLRENVTRQGGGQCHPENLMRFLQTKHESLMKHGSFDNRGSFLEQADHQDVDWKTKYEALKKQEIERKSIAWSEEVVIKAQASLKPDSLGKWVTVANLTNDLKLRVKALGYSQSNRGISWDGWRIQIIDLSEVKEDITRQGGGQCRPTNLMNFFKDNYETLLNNGTFNQI